MKPRLLLSATFSAMLVLLAPGTRAATQPAFYQTLPDATVEERGDRVPGGSRFVPLFANLRFDWNASAPSVTAVITNAVLEGGDPFELIVRSSWAARLNDGTYRFGGDYLQDIHPTGTQYAFEWSFLTSTNGRLLWNGQTYWAGGHIWVVTISNIELLPQPRLSISRVGNGTIQISWETNSIDGVLESISDLSAAGWTTFTNAPVLIDGRYSVTVDANGRQQFYRLRDPSGAYPTKP